MSAKIEHINVHVFAHEAGADKCWLMDIKVNGVTRRHERCGRDYASPGDAVTSARHAVKELVKEQGGKP